MNVIKLCTQKKAFAYVSVKLITCMCLHYKWQDTLDCTRLMIEVDIYFHHS